MELTQVIKITFRIQRGHATCSGAGDGLAVDVVLDVAGGEYAGDAGLGRVAFWPPLVTR
jgi:hypothetical protein